MATRPLIKLSVPVNSSGGWDYNTYTVACAAWAADARTLYLAGDSGEVFAFDTAGILIGRSGHLASRLPGARSRGGKYVASILAIALSPAGDLAVCTDDGQLAAYSEHLKPLWSRTLSARVALTSVIWSPDGAAIIAAGADNLVRMWYLGADAPPAWSQRVGEAPATSLAWDADGVTLWAMTRDGALWALTPRASAPPRRHPHTSPHRAMLTATRDALWISCSAGCWQVRGDVATRVDPAPAQLIAVEQDGRGLVNLCFDTLSVRLTGASAPVLSIPSPGGSHRCVALSPDARWVALAGSGALLLHVADCFGGEPLAPDDVALHPALAGALAGAPCADARVHGAGDPSESLTARGQLRPLLASLHPRAAQAVIAGERAVVWRSNEAPCAISLADGRPAWMLEPGGTSAAPIAARCGDAEVLVYVDGALSCVDAVSGATRWRCVIDAWSSEDRDGALVIVGAVALLAGAYELVAVSLDDGQPVWRWCEPGARFGPCGPLTIVDGLICFTQDSAVWALDAASGAVRWRADGSPRMCWATPGALLRWHYGELAALDAASGVTRWRWLAGVNQNLIAAICAADRLIALDATGVLTALDAASGRVRWSRPLGALKKAPPRPQPERLCAVGAHVLVAWDKEVAGFALEDGASVGAREVRGGARAVCWGAGRLIARSEAGELLWSGPAPAAAAAQTVRVCELGEARGLDMTGEVAWVWPRLLTRGAALVAGEYVVIADAASVALARLADGEQVWSVALSASPDQGMAVMADAVLVRKGWESVVALDLRTGRELWRSPHPPCVAGLTFDAAELALWPLKGALWALVGATGESLWSVEGASLLAMRGDAVWCAVGGRVEARDASSGALRWAWEAGPLDEVCAGVLDGERLVVTLEGGERAVLDAASGAVLEGLAAWDAEAEIEALGGESWRVAAARLGRMAGQGAALATLARDGREAARRLAETHKLAWVEPAEAAGALGERLRAMSSCEGPPLAAAPPLAASAQRIALARRWSLGHRATHLIVSADGARVAVTAHEGGGSVIEAATGAIVERIASAPQAWPVAVDARGVLLCGRSSVALWAGGALAWRRSLGGYDHEAGLDGEQVWAMRGGGLARWERATGRWLGGRWLGERTMPTLPATVAEGRGVRVTLEGASYSQSQHLRVATLDDGALVWREDARVGGVGGLSGALLWGDVAVAWGREGMVGRLVSDGALCWVERWRGCGDRSVAVYGERLWVACGEALWMYVAG